MNQFEVDNISIRGYSHQLKGNECQDASVSWVNDEYSGIIICDGHGGDKYIRSATGAKIACSIGQKLLNAFVNEIKKQKIADAFKTKNLLNARKMTAHNYDLYLSQLERSIIQHWNYEVEKDYLKFPLDKDERWLTLCEKDKQSLSNKPTKAYGTTFIAAILSKDFYFILKLGDGNLCLFREDNSLEIPKELTDEQLQFNMTTSMCSYSADQDFLHCFSENHLESSIKGLIATTDGVINCYNSESAYLSFIKNIFDAYAEDEKRTAHEELEKVLNVMSEKGSGDDLTVAIIRSIQETHAEGKK